MKKLLTAILLFCLVFAFFPASAFAADHKLTLTEDWQLTSDLDLNIRNGEVLILDGANAHYIYEMGGVLKNTGSGTVYLKNTCVYAQGDNPSADTLAALSKAARSVMVVAPAKDATALTLPVVNGYSVSIKSSGNENVISGNGTIVPPSATTTASLVFTLTDSKGNKADTGDIQVTVPARSQNNSDPSSPTGGGSPSAPAVLPGAMAVSYTQSGGDVTLSLSDDKVAEIIGKSDKTAAFNLSGISGAKAALLPRAALDTLSGAGLNVEIKLPQGTVTLDAAAVRSIISAAQGANVSVGVATVASSSLSTAQQAALKSGDKVFDISIHSGTQNVTSFNGTLTAALPYSGPEPAGVWYLSDAGTLENLGASYDAAAGTVTFGLPGHLSLYIVGQDTGAEEWVNPFTDVSNSDWFYSDVEYAVKSSLFSGTTTATFDPNAPMTRGMLAAILGRLHKADVSGYTASSFEDVPEGQYYAPYVEWAKEAGILAGIGNNRFSPDSKITRQDLAVIVMNYAKYADKQFPVTQQFVIFGDEAAIRGYAKDAVQSLYKSGVMIGRTGNIFDPAAGATRAEAASILHRFAERIK